MWTLFKGFFDFMLEAKSFLDHTNFFSPKEYEKNNEIVSAFVS